MALNKSESVRRYTVRLLVALVCALPGLTSAQEVPADKQPMVAVITTADADEQMRNMAAIIHAAATDEAAYRLVDRDAIDAVLREQALAASLGPSDGPQRVKLGKILRADALVILRPLKSEQDSPAEDKGDTASAARAEIVVTETRGGLRLLTQVVQLSPDTDAEVCELILQALRRATQPIADIVAVPQFVDEDLTRHSPAVTLGYTALVRQLVSDQPTLALVDLEEANAISRELRLGDGADRLHRKLPLYLVGKSRHTGSGAERKATFTLVASRGADELSKVELTGLPLAEAGPQLRETATAMLSEAIGQDVRPPDATAELDQLLDVSQQQVRVGELRTGVELLLAALTVDPYDVRARTTLVDLTQKLVTYTPDTKARLDNNHLAAALWLDEATMFPVMWRRYVTGKDNSEISRNDRNYFMVIAEGVNTPLLSLPGTKTWLVDQGATAWEAARDVVIAELEQRNPGELKDAWMVDTAEELVSFQIASIAWRSPREGAVDAAIRAQLAVEKYPGRTPMFHVVPMYSVEQWSIDAMARLEKAGDVFLSRRAAAARLCMLIWRVTSQRRNQLYNEYLQSRQEQERAKVSAPAEEPVPESGTAPTIELQAVKVPESPQGWFAVADGLDVVASRSAIYLARGPGKWKLVHRHPNPVSFEHNYVREGMEELVYDGKYAWAAYCGKEATVAIVDPLTEKVIVFGQADGLPEANLAIVAAPVRPGQVMLCGASGANVNTPRTWYGVLTIEDGKAIFDFLSESTQPMSMSNPHVSQSFIPMQANRPIDPELTDGKPYVAIERGMRYGGGGWAMLLFDVRAGKPVRIARNNLRHRQIFQANGVPYSFNELGWWWRVALDGKDGPALGKLPRMPHDVLQYGNHILCLSPPTIMRDPDDDSQVVTLYVIDDPEKPARTVGHFRPEFTPSEMDVRDSGVVTGMRHWFRSVPWLVRSNAYGGFIYLDRRLSFNGPFVRPYKLAAIDDAITNAHPVKFEDSITKENGRYMLGPSQPLTFADAHTLAQRLGGEVLSIDSEVEQVQVKEVARYFKKDVWLNIESRDGQLIDGNDKPITTAISESDIKARPGGHAVLSLERDTWSLRDPEQKAYLIIEKHNDETADTWNRQLKWEVLADGRPAFVNAAGMRFVWIPPGEFSMGSPEDEPGHKADEVRHKVTLTRGYFMATTETTQGQVRAVDPTQLSSIKTDEARMAMFGAGNDLPAREVWSPEVIQTWLKILNVRDDRQYRLPTEAEWEYACRAGTQTAYSFGNDAADIAQYAVVNTGKSEVELKMMQPVASLRPNAWSLYDMHGNAMEWCDDGYVLWDNQPRTDPQTYVGDWRAVGFSYTDRRPTVGVLRGGAMMFQPDIARSSSRWMVYPAESAAYAECAGFRLVIDAVEVGCDSKTGQRLSEVMRKGEDAHRIDDVDDDTAALISGGG